MAKYWCGDARGTLRLRSEPPIICHCAAPPGVCPHRRLFLDRSFLRGRIGFALGERITLPLAIAGILMGVGIWLHLTEHHEHEHSHHLLEHEHEHVHDEHHQHEHDEPVEPGVKHSHRHAHEPQTHSHPHYPDAHHQHDH